MMLTESSRAARIAAISLLMAVSSLAAAVSGRDYGRLPLRFEKNVGQAGLEAVFVSKTPSNSLYLGPKLAQIALIRAQLDAVVGLRPLDPGPSTRLSGERRAASFSRYIGPEGTLEAPHFEAVRYREIYPGVDWVFYGDPERLEFDFVVSPGVETSRIRLAVEGAAGLEIAADGSLAIATAAGDMRLLAPVAYQTIGGDRRAVEARFDLVSDHVIGFTLGDYDPGRELVIDPVLVYGSYLGGGSADSPAEIIVNAADEAHIVGMTRSVNFPTTPGAVQPDPAGGLCGGSIIAQPCFDLAVTKLNAAGTDLLYSTYIGGTGNETAVGAALDGDGNLIVAGTTTSRNFPVTAGARQSVTSDSATPSDAFVLKLDPRGARIYSTLLGGSDNDEAVGVAGDADGAAYLTGHTRSRDFPVTPGAPQRDNPGDAARRGVFVSKLSADGSTLLYSTYLAGRLEDRAGGIDVTVDGEAVVVGETASPDFPIPAPASPFSRRALQDSLAGSGPDAFVVKLSAAGERLLFGTFLGGGEADGASQVEIGREGSIFVSGSTDSADFPVTPGSVLPIDRRAQGFVTRLAADGSKLVYSSYVIGTTERLAVGADGSAHVSGRVSFGSLFGSGVTATSCNGSILRKFTPDGAALEFSGFLPALQAIDVDSAGFVYTAGSVNTSGLPTTAGAFQSASAGLTDVYVAKWALDEERDASITCIENGASFYPGALAPGEVVTVFGSGLGRRQPAGLIVSGGLVQTELDGVRVLFDGVAAPLLYVGWNQINAVAPYSLAGKLSATITVERDGQSSNAFVVPVVASQPGLFTRSSTGVGLGAILNQDGTINAVDNPAAAGEIVTLFGTGEGQTNPPGIDGLVAPESVFGLASPRLPVRVTVGATEAEVAYVGAAPGLVSGVLQVNVRLPATTPAGEAHLSVQVGGEPNRQEVFVQVK